MISLQAVTKEIDNIDKAVKELSSQIDKSKLKKNACGIIFYDFETDGNALAKKLLEEFSFPIMGVSTIGMLTSNEYIQESMVLTVITADDCDFSMVMTGETGIDDDFSVFDEAYLTARNRLPEKEKLIIMYLPWVPLSYDKLLDRMSVISEGVPVFGGIASDPWNFRKTAVALDGVTSGSRAIMLLISGNVKPLIHLAHASDKVLGTETTVVSADGVLLEEVSEGSAVDYMKRIGLGYKDEPNMADFLGTPFKIIRKMPDGDIVERLRTVGHFNDSENNVFMVGEIKEGDYLVMTELTKNGIEEDVRELFDNLLEEVEQSELQYSLFLISSCAARYSMIVADKQIEAKGYVGRLPENVNVQGVYNYGEFCPVRGNISGTFYNGFNNETFALMAI